MLESVFDTTAKAQTIGQTRLNTFIDDPATTLPYDNGEMALSEIYQKGINPLNKFSTLVVVLLPAITCEPETIDTESPRVTDNYHFVATTTDNHRCQVVFCSIGVKMGLSDELDFPGTEFQEPLNGTVDAKFFNLKYLYSPPARNCDPRLRRRQYLSVTLLILPLFVHASSCDTPVSDTSINTIEVSPSKRGCAIMSEINEAGESYEYAGHRIELIPTGKDEKPFKILINDLELKYDIDKTSSRINSHFFYYSQKNLKEFIKSFIDAYSGHIEEVIKSMNHH